MLAPCQVILLSVQFANGMGVRPALA